jgi:site-specific DNA-adenine methylase
MNFHALIDQFTLFEKPALIKSPMNWWGGKYKLLNQIFPLMPEKIGTFVDMFTGGGDVAINVIADKIIMNDVLTQTIEAYHYMPKCQWSEIDDYIQSQIKKFSLNTEDKKNFYAFRDWYNLTDM